jgi:hypothetical protein
VIQVSSRISVILSHIPNKTGSINGEGRFPVACQTAWGFLAFTLMLIGVPRIFM